MAARPLKLGEKRVLVGFARIIRLKNGKVLVAARYGLKAFPIYRKRNK